MSCTPGQLLLGWLLWSLLFVAVMVLMYWQRLRDALPELHRWWLGLFGRCERGGYCVWDKTGRTEMASRSMNTCLNCGRVEAGPD